jgi:hypothetical protein
MLSCRVFSYQQESVAFMFLFMTTPGFGDTVKALVRPARGADVPRCARATYDAVLGSTHTAKAVHVFTDLERLSDSQLAAAAGL